MAGKATGSGPTTVVLGPAFFRVLLDTTIVTVASPTMQQELSGSPMPFTLPSPSTDSSYLTPPPPHFSPSVDHLSLRGELRTTPTLNG